MRNSDCYRLTKVLLLHLPGFVTNKKNELFIAPIGHVFRGFTFESTAGSREDFYFWWFFMPMVPATDHFYMSHGDRLKVPGGHAGWRLDMQDLPDRLMTVMQARALPFLRSIESIRDTIDAIHELRAPQSVTDINHQNNLACLMILDGQFEDALKMIDKIIAYEQGTDQRQWVLDIVARTKGLREKLLEDPQLALGQVLQWQDFSYKSLQLEKWQ